MDKIIHVVIVPLTAIWRITLIKRLLITEGLFQKLLR